MQLQVVGVSTWNYAYPFIAVRVQASCTTTHELRLAVPMRKVYFVSIFKKQLRKLQIAMFKFQPLVLRGYLIQKPGFSCFFTLPRGRFFLSNLWESNQQVSTVHKNGRYKVGPYYFVRGYNPYKWAPQIPKTPSQKMFGCLGKQTKTSWFQAIWKIVVKLDRFPNFWGENLKTIKPRSRKNHVSGEIIIFHQPRFPWNKRISLTKPPFGVRSCEVAIIWPDVSLPRCHVGFPQDFVHDLDLKVSIWWKNPQCLAFFGEGVKVRLVFWEIFQGPLCYQPKQCTMKGELLQICHTFLVFHSPQIGNLMIPVTLHPRKWTNVDPERVHFRNFIFLLGFHVIFVSFRGNI